jgi:hypothetical protein
MAKRRRKSKLIRVAEVLPAVYPDPDGLRAAKVFGAFTASMPTRLVRNARPVRFDRGTLFVNAATAAWASELTMLAPTMLTKIRARLVGITVQRLRFRVGPLPDVELRPPEILQAVEPVPLATLSPALAGAAARIHDDALREGVLRAAATSIAREKKREVPKKVPRRGHVLEDGDR